MSSESEDPELAKLRALKEAQLRSSILNQKNQNNKSNQKIKVVVYSTPTCPYCFMAKQYLRSRGIEFEDVDVSKDIQAARYMVSQTGEMGVPQINIGGQWVIGFDKQRIDLLLNLI
jgi:glutaredoxin-like YruB-family protein